MTQREARRTLTPSPCANERGKHGLMLRMGPPLRVRAFLVVAGMALSVAIFPACDASDANGDSTTSDAAITSNPTSTSPEHQGDASIVSTEQAETVTSSADDTEAPSPSQDAGTTSAMPAYERVGCDLRAAITFCGGGTCHYDGSAEFGSDLALVDRDTQDLSEGVEARLVNVPAGYNNVLSPDDCPSEPELLIDPFDVEQSLIIKKLMGTHTCGDEMPKFPYPEWGATNNPGEQRDGFVDCIRQWVTLLAEDYSKGQ